MPGELAVGGPRFTTGLFNGPMSTARLPIDDQLAFQRGRHGEQNGMVQRNHRFSFHPAGQLESTGLTARHKQINPRVVRTNLTKVEQKSCCASQPQSSGGAFSKNGPEGLEKSVTAIFNSTLGDKYPNPDDGRFLEGNHSILLVRLQARIREKLNIAPPVSQFIEEPTVAAVCTYIRQNKGCAASNTEDTTIDWSLETKLPTNPRYIPQYSIPRVDRDDINRILVTGAELSVGLFLLAEILVSKRDAVVYVLGSLKPLSTDDLMDLLENHGLVGISSNGHLDRDDVLSRVRCVYGCLSKPRLGLNRSEFLELGREVQTIYHLGGHVCLLKTYTQLKSVNVTPILDLIQLAGTGEHLSEIHYLSSWSVGHLQSWSLVSPNLNTWVATEDDMSHFQPPAENQHGYFKSLWVVEALLCSAASRGFPVTITRASAVTNLWHGSLMSTGDEFALRMILAMVDSGMIPTVGSPKQPQLAVDLVPVDYLVRGLFTLTSERAAVESCSISRDKPLFYHISNPKPLELRDLSDVMKALSGDGREMEIVSLERWMQTLAAQEKKANGATEVLWATILREYLGMGHVMFPLDSGTTDESLEDLLPGFSEQCPPVNVAMLERLLGGLRRVERV
ncbi:amino acid adenylation domain-containing protein [Verticillium alfalfae VaMs.102]|uniref:Amino acid adenylation domain-containing protein n=1 Tax=Verticillium alfalfae (strain VaMs.102 / ATCC MYA-4576 / FGSC 10136) TaxID=526221 RepID=C9S6F6_VERA1|nr:amino acid adenylation domain-containing protein [Verticillium alfalfae VaMs.102]EEY14468.1 amino acid adenylation domain-containing protein [Verticillium alfalfae VaMs.102]